MGSEKEHPEDLQAYVTLMTEHQGNLRAFIVSLLPGSPDRLIRFSVLHSALGRPGWLLIPFCGG